MCMHVRACVCACVCDTVPTRSMSQRDPSKHEARARRANCTRSPAGGMAGRLGMRRSGPGGSCWDGSRREQPPLVQAFRSARQILRCRTRPRDTSIDRYQYRYAGVVIIWCGYMYVHTMAFKTTVLRKTHTAPPQLLLGCGCGGGFYCPLSRSAIRVLQRGLCVRVVNVPGDRASARDKSPIDHLAISATTLMRAWPRAVIPGYGTRREHDSEGRASAE